MLFGDKNDLITAVSTGAVVKVSIFDNNFFTSVENLIFINGHICGQALFEISKSGPFNFQVNLIILLNNEENVPKSMLNLLTVLLHTKFKSIYFIRH